MPLLRPLAPGGRGRVRTCNPRRPATTRSPAPDSSSAGATGSCCRSTETLFVAATRSLLQTSEGRPPPSLSVAEAPARAPAPGCRRGHRRAPRPGRAARQAAATRRGRARQLPVAAGPHLSGATAAAAAAADDPGHFSSQLHRPRRSAPTPSRAGVAGELRRHRGRNTRLRPRDRAGRPERDLRQAERERRRGRNARSTSSKRSRTGEIGRCRGISPVTRFTSRSCSHDDGFVAGGGRGAADAEFVWTVAVGRRGIGRGGPVFTPVNRLSPGCSSTGGRLPVRPRPRYRARCPPMGRMRRAGDRARSCRVQGQVCRPR